MPPAFNPHTRTYFKCSIYSPSNRLYTVNEEETQSEAGCAGDLSRRNIGSAGKLGRFSGGDKNQTTAPSHTDMANPKQKITFTSNLPSGVLSSPTDSVVGSGPNYQINGHVKPHHHMLGSNATTAYTDGGDEQIVLTNGQVTPENLSIGRRKKHAKIEARRGDPDFGMMSDD